MFHYQQQALLIILKFGSTVLIQPHSTQLQQQLMDGMMEAKTMIMLLLINVSVSHCQQTQLL